MSISWHATRAPSWLNLTTVALHLATPVCARARTHRDSGISVSGRSSWARLRGNVLAGNGEHGLLIADRAAAVLHSGLVREVLNPNCETPNPKSSCARSSPCLLSSPCTFYPAPCALCPKRCTLHPESYAAQVRCGGDGCRVVPVGDRRRPSRL
jgi:hypothetical protein